MIETFWIMSVQASVLIGAVCILRLFLAKSPKVYSYVLWLLVLFRLLCPIFIESRFSLQPDIQMLLPPDDAKTFPQAYQSVNEQKSSDYDFGTPKTYDTYSVDSTIPLTQNFLVQNRTLLRQLWIAGALFTATVFVIQYFLLRRRLNTAIRETMTIWRCDQIDTPFVMGVIIPKIYLPFSLKEDAYNWILQHEKMHIKHKDHLVRTAQMAALCLHWWNPFVWYAAHKMNQDMEMFCDEAVLSGKEQQWRLEYAKTLLNFAIHKDSYLPGVFFSKSNTEKRIVHILQENKTSYRKTFAVTVSIIAVIFVFLTVPWKANASETKPDEVAFLVKTEEKLKHFKSENDPVAFDMEAVCGITQKQADLFLEKFANDVKSGDRQAVAAVFSYPLYFMTENEKIQIQSEQEFLACYNQIFTGQLLSTLDYWKHEEPFYNWKGVSWGNGSLWINIRNGKIQIDILRTKGVALEQR